MAVGVSYRGQTVFARGYGLANIEHRSPLTPDSPFLLASVTKQFTAAAVLLLVQDGKVRLDDKLSKYVPELPQAKHVTVRQLLIHTSGIPDYSEDPDGAASKSVARTSTDMIAWIARLRPAQLFTPGTVWRYSNSNYVLLGSVIERTSGSTLADFFRKRLFEPAGLTDTAWDDPRDVVDGRAQGYVRARKTASGFTNAEWISPSVPGAAGGLRTTINDLLRWSEALHSAKIIDANSLRLMTRAGRLSDGRSTKSGMPVDWQQGMNADYGLGVFITPLERESRVWHPGDVDGFSTWLAHYPKGRVTIALMVNSQSVDVDKEVIERAALSGIGTVCP
jgi:CubicO group peptidase (beta-lactamase class C family)